MRDAILRRRARPFAAAVRDGVLSMSYLSGGKAQLSTVQLGNGAFHLELGTDQQAGVALVYEREGAARSTVARFESWEAANVGFEAIGRMLAGGLVGDSSRSGWVGNLVRWLAGALGRLFATGILMAALVVIVWLAIGRPPMAAPAPLPSPQVSAPSAPAAYSKLPAPAPSVPTRQGPPRPGGVPWSADDWDAGN